MMTMMYNHAAEFSSTQRVGAPWTGGSFEVCVRVPFCKTAFFAVIFENSTLNYILLKTRLLGLQFTSHGSNFNLCDVIRPKLPNSVK